MDEALKKKIEEAYAKYEVLQGARYRSQEEVFTRGADIGYHLRDSEVEQLRGALDEMVHVFDRPEHNNETGFAEFSSIRRAKEALTQASKV